MAPFLGAIFTSFIYLRLYRRDSELELLNHMVCNVLKIHVDTKRVIHPSLRLYPLYVTTLSKAGRNHKNTAEERKLMEFLGEKLHQSISNKYYEFRC